MQEPTAPPHVPDSADMAGTPDAAKPSDGKPAPQKSMYDSLEQEMASLLKSAAIETLSAIVFRFDRCAGQARGREGGGVTCAATAA